MTGRGATRRAARRPAPPQTLRVGERLQSAPPGATGERLAHVGAAGQSLLGAGDGHPQVDVLVPVADEATAQLLVQLGRNSSEGAQQRTGRLSVSDARSAAEVAVTWSR